MRGDFANPATFDGANGCLPDQFGIGKKAGVGKLHDDFTAVIVHGFCHGFKTRNQSIVVNSQLPGTGLTLGADIGMAADDQAQSPFGKLSHQIDELRGTSTVICSHSLPGCRSNESVRKLHAVNGAGFEWFVHFILSLIKF